MSYIIVGLAAFWLGHSMGGKAMARDVRDSAGFLVNLFKGDQK